jgi:hypothetical protein
MFEIIWINLIIKSLVLNQYEINTNKKHVVWLLSCSLNVHWSKYFNLLFSFFIERWILTSKKGVKVVIMIWFEYIYMFTLSPHYHHWKKKVCTWVVYIQSMYISKDLNKYNALGYVEQRSNSNIPLLFKRRKKEVRLVIVYIFTMYYNFVT